MATIDEIAQEYAAQIMRAKRVVAETRSATSASQLELAVRAVLEGVDRLVFEGGKSLDEAAKKSVLVAIDKALNISIGTFLALKEGSAQSLIAFQNLIAELAQQIQYK